MLVERESIVAARSETDRWVGELPREFQQMNSWAKMWYLPLVPAQEQPDRVLTGPALPESIAFARRQYKRSIEPIE